MLQFFEGLRAEDLPDGQGWAVEQDASLIWEGHKAGRRIGYCHLEKLHSLEQLPSTGFTGGLDPGDGYHRQLKLQLAEAGC
jgi:hypothetical protein